MRADVRDKFDCVAECLLDLRLQVRPVGQLGPLAVDVSPGDVPGGEDAGSGRVGQYLGLAVLLPRVGSDETCEGVGVDLRRHLAACRVLAQ